MKTKNKVVLLALCMVALIAVSVLGTMAYLATKTAPIVNTFTVGNVSIALAETTSEYKMVPGNDIDKDPKVTVKANSEDCWLFVKIDESANLEEFIQYSVATGWTQLTDDKGNVDGVFFRTVPTSENDQVFEVLADNKVTVLSTVTKDALQGITSSPTLTFTAYAVQEDNVGTALDAWKIANDGSASVETTTTTTTPETPSPVEP
ncbi:MAG: hypothetical protein ACI4T6_12235 [Candidatus Flemingiibacterium sp.]